MFTFFYFHITGKIESKDRTDGQSEVNAEIMFLSLYPTDGYETIDATKLEIDPGTSLTYQWKGCGLKLKVPTNALDSNVSSRILGLHTCTTDQFKIPEDMELVSAIYWVDFVEEFANPISVFSENHDYKRFSVSR